MREYPKIENLYARDDGTHKLIPGVYKRADFTQVGAWLVTEKVDGTNVRVIYDARDQTVTVRGRSDAAQLPTGFTDEAFPGGLDPEVFAAALASIDQAGKAGVMTVYGEGYGPGIQKNGVGYAQRKSFVAFDVVTYLIEEIIDHDADGQQRPRYVSHSPLWRTFADVKTVCAVAGLASVPVLGEGCSTQTALYIAENDTASLLARRNELERESEGIVARTDPYLFDFRGDRVLFKLKPKDLP